MLRRGLIIPVMLFAVPVAGAAWVYSPVLLGTNSAPGPPGQPATPQRAAVQSPDLEALKPRDGSAQSASFDVARISPDGWSVFAGTAPPDTSVTVMADGKPIGTAKADERGEWTLLSDHKFASRDPVLGIETGTDQAARITERQVETPADIGPTRRMMRDLEDLVTNARDPEPSHTTQAAVHAPVPVPIQFVFRKAVFTQEGRRAAELLLEYLKLTKPDSIVLTGHADERGTEEFNLELSRQRLETVAAYLKQNGFEGRLELIPKGRSEPYQGVDRASLDRHTLWQLDRRVELHLGTEPQPHRSAQDGNRSSIWPSR